MENLMEQLKLEGSASYNYDSKIEESYQEIEGFNQTKEKDQGFSHNKSKNNLHPFLESNISNLNNKLDLYTILKQNNCSFCTICKVVIGLDTNDCNEYNFFETHAATEEHRGNSSSLFKKCVQYCSYENVSYKYDYIVNNSFIDLSVLVKLSSFVSIHDTRVLCLVCNIEIFSSLLDEQLLIGNILDHLRDKTHFKNLEDSFSWVCNLPSKGCLKLQKDLISCCICESSICCNENELLHMAVQHIETAHAKEFSSFCFQKEEQNKDRGFGSSRCRNDDCKYISTVPGTPKKHSDCERDIDDDSLCSDESENDTFYSFSDQDSDFPQETSSIDSDSEQDISLTAESSFSLQGDNETFYSFSDQDSDFPQETWIDSQISLRTFENDCEQDINLTAESSFSLQGDNETFYSFSGRDSDRPKEIPRFETNKNTFTEDINNDFLYVHTEDGENIEVLNNDFEMSLKMNCKSNSSEISTTFDDDNNDATAVPLMCPECGECVEVFSDDYEFSLELHSQKHNGISNGCLSSSVFEKINFDTNADYVCSVCDEIIEVFNKNVELSFYLHNDRFHSDDIKKGVTDERNFDLPKTFEVHKGVTDERNFDLPKTFEVHKGVTDERNFDLPKTFEVHKQFFERKESILYCSICSVDVNTDKIELTKHINDIFHKRQFLGELKKCLLDDVKYQVKFLIFIAGQLFCSFCKCYIKPCSSFTDICETVEVHFEKEIHLKIVNQISGLQPVKEIEGRCTVSSQLVENGKETEIDNKIKFSQPVKKLNISSVAIDESPSVSNTKTLADDKIKFSQPVEKLNISSVVIDESSSVSNNKTYADDKIKFSQPVEKLNISSVVVDETSSVSNNMVLTDDKSLDISEKKVLDSEKEKFPSADGRLGFLLKCQENFFFCVLCLDLLPPVGDFSAVIYFNHHLKAVHSREAEIHGSNVVLEDLIWCNNILKNNCKFVTISKKKCYCNLCKKTLSLSCDLKSFLGNLFQHFEGRKHQRKQL